MIKINIELKDNICKFKLEGHAEYAEHGKDIICSGVSVLVINTINSIEKFTNSKIKCKTFHDGNVDCEIINIDKNSKMLIRSMVLGLTNIKKEYGSEYIEIDFMEV